MVWDTKRAIHVYQKVFPMDTVTDDDPRKQSIVAEMNDVKHASTLEAAASVIDWWGWDDDFTAIDAAKRIRRFRA